ncbi:MAG: M23 family metallopeptidase [Clostridia bacterium]|nr:M23 family metallopeptidase [Clostridia bacterium]
MRRDLRKKQDNKILMYSIGAGLVLIAIVFALWMYSISQNNDVRNSQLNSDQIASILKNDDSESASNNMGKSVEEGKADLENNDETNKNNETSKTNASNEKEGNLTSNTDNNQNTNTKVNNSSNKLNASQETNANTTSKTSEYKTETNVNKQEQANDNNSATTETSAKATKKEENKDLVFQKPVEGEIVKEFAKDNLIYSDTLKEWVTHLGIDIKADKTTVVNASEAGTIKTIKNDPRYGLTIVIDHDNGFQTVYANLLSAEFVKAGDKVEKGQAIGTVGNTAMFESVDEPHLHFELLKDSIQVDPNIYLR